MPSKFCHLSVKTSRFQSGCPTGCPCPNYSCGGETTTVAQTEPPIQSLPTVLVLNQGRSLLTDRYGREDFDINFEYGEDTEVYMTCMLFYNNEAWFFGGNHLSTQISKISGCKLERVGSLAFYFTDGVCTMFRNELFLCFDQSSDGEQMNLCRNADSPLGTFTKITHSHYNHDYQNDISASESKKPLF